MIYLSNDTNPQEIRIPRSLGWTPESPGVIPFEEKKYLTIDDIAANLDTDDDRKILAASQGVILKEKIDGKADANDVYTKTEVDDSLADKADKDDTYTKQQVDTALAQKANAGDIPTKTSDLQNDSGFVTGQQVSQTYETKEDATAKETALQTAINGKQDKINDLQSIRDGAAAGATAYQKPQTGIPASDIAPGVIPDVSQFIEKDVDDLTNYYKKSETYTKQEVEDGLSEKQDIIDANHKLDYSLLDNTPSIPAAQVPADWDATSGVSRILNKPSIPVNYAGSPTPGGFAHKAVAIPFGEVDSDSTSTDIKASVDNFPTTLVDGVCAYIRNNVVASASGWTLNINGTGAKPVYASNADATRTTTIFSAAVTYLFIYNSSRVEGGCWDMYYGYNANDNTIGYNIRTSKMTLPLTSNCYRYRLLFTSADGTKFVPANASSSTNATSSRTTTQTPIDPFGTIRYYSYTSAVNSGSKPGASYLWQQYVVTLGYSFNRTGAALVLDLWKPIYLHCQPQADGSAIIDAENPYVQTLPTQYDGKIYIYLGVVVTETTMELTLEHPVYYIDRNGRKRVWTGEDLT